MKSVTFSDIVCQYNRTSTLLALCIGRVPAASPPGRLEVTTRFPARHLVGTLDDALGRLGYTPAGHELGSLRYRTRPRVRALNWAPWGRKNIAVQVRDLALEVTGPVQALQALRRDLGC